MRALLLLVMVGVLLRVPVPSAQAAGKESPAVAAARQLFEAQLVAITRYKDSSAEFAPDASILVDNEMTSGWWKPDEMPMLFDSSSGGAGPVEVQRSKFVAAADGKSVWIFAQLRVMEYNPGTGPGFWVGYRVTELVAAQDGAWKLVAGNWTVGVADKEVNRRFAAGGEVSPERLIEGDLDRGDAELAALVGGALRAQRLAELVSDRADLVVVGSAPKELVNGGKKWRSALAGWKDRLHLLGGVRAEVAPGGTTGWAVATLAVDKEAKGKKYQIPFHLFVVLEKGAAGWQVVQAHLAIAG
jgi:ketosteroid isomerase-like protein